MKQDQRSKTARVAAVLVMAKERGRPVSRKIARSVVGRIMYNQECARLDPKFWAGSSMYDL